MFYVLAILIGFSAGFLASYLSLEHRRRLISNDVKKYESDRLQLTEDRSEFDAESRRMRESIEAFKRRFATVEVLENENAILKNDLRNLDLQSRKLAMDRDQQERRQAELRREADSLAKRFLKDTVTWIGRAVTSNNFTSSKKRLERAISSCRKIGFAISETEENELHANLKDEYSRAVKAAFEREEQARIKARIREEARREREIKDEVERLERERAAIAIALNKALAESRDEHSAEIEHLRQQLAEAEQQSQRAMSQAQLTKSGHVYVISNIGSFGEGVFKIGMTRRLEPLLRVKELGDASVPFPFDIHMMISTDNAPSLENAIHKRLHQARLNRVNPRKEFFRSDLEPILEVIREHHGEVEYVADAEALEYRQSLETNDEEMDVIERTYEEAGFIDEDDE